MTPPTDPIELLLSTGSLRNAEAGDILALAETAGFTGIEYVVGVNHTPDHAMELARRSEDAGIPVRNIHAPYVHIPEWGGPVESILRTVDLAVRIGARSITFHPPQRVMEDVGFAHWIAQTDDFQRDVGGGEVLVTVENMPKVKYWRGIKVPFTTSPFRYQNRDELWELLERHNLYMTFDTTHYGTTGENLGACYSQFRDRIRTIHLSNFDATAFEEHMPPHEGDLDLEDFLQRIDGAGYAGLMTLEVQPRVIETHPDGPHRALEWMVGWVRRVLSGERAA